MYIYLSIFFREILEIKKTKKKKNTKRNVLTNQSFH